MAEFSQKQYMEDVAQIMAVRARGPQPMAFVHTYGCQQNVADGEKIKGQLEEMGFGFTDDVNEADFILFNTCAIREHAEDRVFGNVGALKNVKRRHPSVLIALCGCMMEQEHVAERIRKSFPYVNLVFGTHVIHKFPELMFRMLTDGRRVFERGDDSEDRADCGGASHPPRWKCARVVYGDVWLRQFLFLLHCPLRARQGAQPLSPGDFRGIHRLGAGRI